MSQKSVPDQFEGIPSNLDEMTGHESQSIDKVDLDDYHWSKRPDSGPKPPLEWKGPLAFARAHGQAPGIDHDLGSNWWSNGDQRVSLRLEVGASVGVVFVYDPTWDEYAIIGTDVPLGSVQIAIERAQVSEQMAVEDIVALLPNALEVRPSAGPEP